MRDVPTRARKLNREVLMYWRRQDKQQIEEQKKAHKVLVCTAKKKKSLSLMAIQKCFLFFPFFSFWLISCLLFIKGGNGEKKERARITGCPSSAA